MSEAVCSNGNKRPWILRFCGLNLAECLFSSSCKLSRFLDTTGSEDNIKRDFNYRDKNQNGVLEVVRIYYWAIHHFIKLLCGYILSV